MLEDVLGAQRAASRDVQHRVGEDEMLFLDGNQQLLPEPQIGDADEARSPAQGFLHFLGQRFPVMGPDPLGLKFAHVVQPGRTVQHMVLESRGEFLDAPILQAHPDDLEFTVVGMIPWAHFQNLSPRPVEGREDQGLAGTIPLFGHVNGFAFLPTVF